MPRLKTPTPPESGRITTRDDLGGIIRYMRIQAGLTADEAAMAIGVAKATLLRAEQGKGGLQFENVLRILDGLGVTLYAAPSARGAGEDFPWPKT